MKKVFILILTSFFALGLSAQDPERFRDEIEIIKKKDFTPDPIRKTIVFTGSSSIRLWKNLDKIFPDYQTVNTGFGGSTMGELLFFYNDLIRRYEPDQVFIYEGDNDVAINLPLDTILSNTSQLLNKIHKDFPSCKIVLIAAKPSIARWKLKDKYIELNKEYKNISTKNDGIEYADIWKPALNNSGMPKPEIFIKDNLHLNDKGYEIWEKVIQPLLLNN